MKRFYKLVSHRKISGGYDILLDGRPLQTQQKNTLHVEREDLADVIVAEWAAQGEKIIPDSMPLTQIVSTGIDHVPIQRPQMEPQVLKYFDTDLLCYRTDDPEVLGKMQREIWDPWLKWFEERFGHQLQTTNVLVALSHSEVAHRDVRDYVGSLSNERFTILQMVTPMAGSIILAMAFVEGAISPQKLYEAIRVEETYKAKLYDEDKYGPDPAQETKDTAIKKDLAAAVKYLES